MKTNTKRTIIAIAALLLLAIGAGVYMNHKNIPDEQNTATSVNSESPAAITPAPVVTQAPVAIQSENAAMQNTSEDRQNGCGTNVKNNRKMNNRTFAVNSKSKHFHSKGKRKAKSADEDQLDVSTATNYAGQVPVSKSPAAATAYAVAYKPAATTQNVTANNQYQDKNKKGHNGGVNFAPEVGVNLNSLNHNSTSDILTNGFHAGVMVNIGISKALAVQPGLMYILKGNEDKSVSTDLESQNEVNTTRKIKTGYVELPVNVVYKFGDKTGKPRFMVGAGPYAAYMVHAENNTQSVMSNNEGFVVNTQNTSSSPMANMNKFDYGVGGFIGCQMPKGFYAKMGAEWGLRDISVDPVTGNTSDRNYNMLLSVGYILGPNNKTY